MQGHLPYILGGSTLGGFVPTDIAGCVLWLQSDRGITKDGGNLVSSWADQSGNGHDANQGVGAQQPLWVDAQVNGLPVIRFDGIDDLLDHAQITLNSGFSAFYIVKATTDCLLGTIDATYTRQIRYHQVANKLSVADGVNNPTSDLLNTAAGNWLLAEFIDTDTIISFYENGTARGTDACVAMEFGQISSLALPINGDVAEMIIFNSALSDANRLLVENYLNGRYAIY